jgi:hypothetical protein
MEIRAKKHELKKHTPRSIQRCRGLHYVNNLTHIRKQKLGITWRRNQSKLSVLSLPGSEFISSKACWVVCKLFGQIFPVPFGYDTLSLLENRVSRD